MKRRFAQAAVALAAAVTLWGGTSAMAFAESVEAGAGESKEVDGDYNNAYSHDGGSVTVNGNVTEDEDGDGGFASASGSGSSTTVTGDADKAYAEKGGTVTVGGDSKDAYATGEGSSITVGGDISDEAYADGGGTVTVDGDSSAEANADGEGSSVSVGGNTGYAQAYNGGTVSVGGDTGYADAYNGGTATVDGDSAEATAEGEGSSVTIGGGVDHVISASDGGEVTVDGDCYLEFGIDADGGTISIGGDVFGNINLQVNPDITNNITVEGTVQNKVDDYNTTPISIDATVRNEDGESTDEAYDYDTVLNSSQITVWKIVPDGDSDKLVEVHSFGTDGEENEALHDEEKTSLEAEIEAGINYIIKIDNPELSAYDLDGNPLTTGIADQSIIIKVKEGYTISSITGGTAELTKNEDGTYTLVVPRGGGVEVSAVLKAILPNPTDPVEPTPDPGKTTDPEKPAEPVKPTDPVKPAPDLEKCVKVEKTAAVSTTTTDAVQTGDTNNALPYALALIVSAAGITWVVQRKRSAKA